MSCELNLKALFGCVWERKLFEEPKLEMIDCCDWLVPKILFPNVGGPLWLFWPKVNEVEFDTSEGAWKAKGGAASFCSLGLAQNPNKLLVLEGVLLAKVKFGVKLVPNNPLVFEVGKNFISLLSELPEPLPKELVVSKFWELKLKRFVAFVIVVTADEELGSVLLEPKEKRFNGVLAAVEIEAIEFCEAKLKIFDGTLEAVTVVEVEEFEINAFCVRKVKRFELVVAVPVVVIVDAEFDCGLLIFISELTSILGRDICGPKLNFEPNTTDVVVVVACEILDVEIVNKEVEAVVEANRNTILLF